MKLKIVIVVFFILSLFIAVFAPEEYNNIFIRTVLFLQVCSVIIFIFYYKKLFGNINWISPTMLFLLSYTIVNFQIFYYLVLGYPIKPHLYEFFFSNVNVIPRSVAYSFLGQTSFFLGYTVLYKKRIMSFINIDKFVQLSKKNSILFFLTIATYGIYISFIIFSEYYKLGKYKPTLEPRIAGYLFFAFNLFLTSLVIQKVISISHIKETKITILDYINSMGMPITLLVAWHIIFSFIVGDRGPIISYGLMYFGLFFYRWYRLKLIYLVFILVIASNFFTILSTVRRFDQIEFSVEEMSKNNKMNIFEKIIFVFQHNTRGRRFVNNQSVPFEGTVELATSTRCLNHVISNVPDTYDYQYGYFQLKQIISIIPKGSSTVLSLKNGNKKFDGSASFVTFLIQGENPKYGDGTSINADLYLDFGALGIVVGLFLFGIFLKRSEFELQTGFSRVFIGVATIIYFSFSIYLGRSSLLFFLKSIVMTYFIILINYFIMNILNRTSKL